MSEYIAEKNELWKKVLEERISEKQIEVPEQVLDYLRSWIFTEFFYKDFFDEENCDENEFPDGIHYGLRYWDVELNGSRIAFQKKECYNLDDVPEEWSMDDKDFEKYLEETYGLNTDEMIWVLSTIDELIFTI